jgi:predicted site-specific integrase-resolvase
MEQFSKRKYNSDFRKRLVTKFEKIKNKNDYFNIYNIINEDIGNNFSSNRNGIFVNMNLLSDNCIEKIVNFMNDKLNTTNTQSETEKVNYKAYKIDDIEIISDMGHKLSNQEKSIIKRIRNKVSI